MATMTLAAPFSDVAAHVLPDKPGRNDPDGWSCAWVAQGVECIEDRSPELQGHNGANGARRGVT